MPALRMKTLDVKSRVAWRSWLRRHHDARTEIWLVFYKKHTGRPSIGYTDAVEEALCFGWIDSLVKRLDDDRYARLFTPRRPNSRWSTSNRRRYADMQRRGLLAAAGRRRPPTDRSGDATRAVLSAMPGYLAQALKANTRAQSYFEQLAPSHRRAYVGWIDSAKRQETKEKRLREGIELLAAGKKLGLK